MPMKISGKKKKKRTRIKRKKKQKPKMLEPYEMPDILKMMTKTTFYKLKLKNLHEKTGSIDFVHEFSESELVPFQHHGSGLSTGATPYLGRPLLSSLPSGRRG